MNEKKSATHSVALSIGSALLHKVDEAYRASSQPLSVNDNTTVADIMQTIGMSDELTLLVVLNDAMVPRTHLATQSVSNGDKLSLMPPIHAG